MIGVNSLSGGSESEPTADASSSRESDPVSPSNSVEPVPEPVAEPAYQTRLDYSNEGIPNQSPSEGLEFVFDVCSGDAQWAKPAFQNSVRMQVKQGTTWKNVPVIPKIQKGGRCDPGKLNMTISHKMNPALGLEVDGTWTTCQSYRVILPETPDFKKTSVPFCAFVKQTA